MILECQTYANGKFPQLWWRVWYSPDLAAAGDVHPCVGEGELAISSGQAQYILLSFAEPRERLEGGWKLIESVTFDLDTTNLHWRIADWDRDDFQAVWNDCPRLTIPQITEQLRTIERNLRCPC